MTHDYDRSVLLVGGSGLVGARTAETLRRLHPTLPLTIGGRDLAKAEAVARRIGHASALQIDLEREDLGLPDSARFAALALFLKDPRLTALRFAQTTGAAYVDIASGAFEIAPEVALYAHAPTPAPVLLASHYLAGVTTLAALYFARAFARVSSIEIGALLDEQDLGGPAAFADYERYTATASSALVRVEGRFDWVRGDAARRDIVSVDGVVLEGNAYSVLDTPTLAAATGAPSVRFDLAVGESASRRAGRPFSTEIFFSLRGVGHDGAALHTTHTLVHPDGQAPLTALGVALLLERLLGLAGSPKVAPGLHMPSTLLDPEAVMARLRELGATVRTEGGAA